MIDSRGVTFCSRTTFAFIAGGTGIMSGYLVCGSRIICGSGTTRLFGRCCCSISTYTRAKGEAILSFFLVIFFGVAVALITSIGGPGQTVGDLYYATWLAFWVCLGTFVSCYDEVKQGEIEADTLLQQYQDQFTSDYIDLGDSHGGSAIQKPIANGRFA